jgi:hypothetical protein
VGGLQNAVTLAIGFESLPGVVKGPAAELDSDALLAPDAVDFEALARAAMRRPPTLRLP